jgi:predicted DNA-binding transcriptional regulator AlpA
MFRPVFDAEERDGVAREKRLDTLAEMFRTHARHARQLNQQAVDQVYAIYADALPPAVAFALTYEQFAELIDSGAVTVKHLEDLITSTTVAPADSETVSQATSSHQSPRDGVACEGDGVARATQAVEAARRQLAQEVVLAGGRATYSEAEVLARFPRSRATLYRWIKDGTFPRPIKQVGRGSANRWAVDDIHRYFQMEQDEHGE